jgi:predicted transcriptional regulator
MSEKELKPTESELEILQVLWKKGPSLVRTVNDELNEWRDIGYTTTLKLMQIMAEKGLLSRTKEGRGHIYHPEVEKSATQKQMLDKVLNGIFAGSASTLVMQALGNHQASDEELNKIKNYIEQLEGGKS